MRLAERIGRLERGHARRDDTQDAPADVGALHDIQDRLRRFYEADPEALALWLDVTGAACTVAPAAGLAGDRLDEAVMLAVDADPDAARKLAEVDRRLRAFEEGEGARFRNL